MEQIIIDMLDKYGVILDMSILIFVIIACVSLLLGTAFLIEFIKAWKDFDKF